jgi:hypothetical protein
LLLLGPDYERGLSGRLLGTGREGYGGEEGGRRGDVFERLVETFSVFGPRPRPLAFHGERIQSAKAGWSYGVVVVAVR